MHWKIRLYVDREVNVYENDERYDVYHSIVQVIVNTSNCLHYVVLNNLLMNQQFSDKDPLQWKKMRYVDNYNLNIEKKRSLLNQSLKMTFT